MKVRDTVLVFIQVDTSTRMIRFFWLLLEVMVFSIAHLFEARAIWCLSACSVPANDTCGDICNFEKSVCNYSRRFVRLALTWPLNG